MIELAYALWRTQPIIGKAGNDRLAVRAYVVQRVPPPFAGVETVKIEIDLRHSPTLRDEPVAYGDCLVVVPAGVTYKNQRETPSQM